MSGGTPGLDDCPGKWRIYVSKYMPPGIGTSPCSRKGKSVSAPHVALKAPGVWVWLGRDGTTPAEMPRGAGRGLSLWLATSRPVHTAPQCGPPHCRLRRGPSTTLLALGYRRYGGMGLVSPNGHPGRCCSCGTLDHM